MGTKRVPDRMARQQSTGHHKVYGHNYSYFTIIFDKKFNGKSILNLDL